jgi:hypothetical protein
MISLRENIYKVNFTDPISAWILRVARENGQVTRKRGRVAGKIDDFLRSYLDQARERPRGHARSRRIEHNQIRPIVPVLEKGFHSSVTQIG